MLDTHVRASRLVATTVTAFGLAACDSPADPFPFGVLEIRTATTGASLDADGFMLRWEDGFSASVGISDTLTRALSTRTGAQRMELSDVAPNCALAGDASRRIGVVEGETTVVTFSVDCAYVPRDIVFERSLDGTAIHAVGSDGAYTVRVTSRSARAPAWSPDGGNLAFAVGHDPGSSESFAVPQGVEITEADGTPVRTIEAMGDATVYDISWAPDGQRLMYTTWRWEDWCPEDGIWIVDRTGTDRDYLGFGHGTGWSPDGLHVAVARSVSRDPCDPSDIHILAVEDWSEVSILAEHPASDTDAVWSPDGSRIAFSSARSGNHDIYVAHIDGGDIIQLTDHPEWDGHPAWSPDGSRIVFASRRDGNGAIYLMDADGSGLLKLTDHPGDDRRPSWRPRVAEGEVQTQRAAPQRR